MFCGFAGSFAGILLSGSFWGSSRVKGQGLGLGLESVGFGAYRALPQVSIAVAWLASSIFYDLEMKTR